MEESNTRLAQRVGSGAMLRKAKIYSRWHESGGKWIQSSWSRITKGGRDAWYLRRWHYAHCVWMRK